MNNKLQLSVHEDGFALPTAEGEKLKCEGSISQQLCLCKPPAYGVFTGRRYKGKASVKEKGLAGQDINS